MPDKTERIVTACNATTIPLVHINLKEQDSDKLHENLTAEFAAATDKLVTLNKRDIKEKVKVYATGPYTYLSWHHDHTTTMIGNILIVSMFSTALVSGELNIEDNPEEDVED